MEREREICSDGCVSEGLDSVSMCDYFMLLLCGAWKKWICGAT